MSKQLNVDLRFNADVSQARAQLQSLQQSLNSLTTATAGQLNITPQIKEAQQAAVHLKTALQQSMNIETGKFDLSKFNSSLKSMGTDLSKLKTQLISVGPSGQQTFMQLAQSIMTAEIPTRRVNTLFAQLGTTLKNTARWQISSSLLHGFTRAVSTAYNYAKDLNESLNNIRIVTEQSAEQMDKFALRANKAAKALSASTLEYTKASLIYYQQGLNDKQVEERTNATIKMANVTGTTAEEVSQQMTAIWNNFDNGSKSLEYYADVVTALGAATASSSDEIAQGLEKFAAVAETVGLSYEYATAALATVTATTRQSADVVGTAFKTLFARIQDLDLGKTLDDGTTLGSYSQALASVGINIKDANGGLRDMNDILDEMGAKWQQLDKDQQVALAKSVAGIRQYTQLIALMDNWDFMEQNITTAENATGTLTKQAKIYEESWEAANKRVKASMEAIYTDLLDDDFFIGLTDELADVLNFVDKLLDSMGGAKGLLLGLSSILLNMFAGAAAKGLENMVYNFRSFVGLAEKEALAIQNMAMQLVNSSSNTAMMQNATHSELASNDVMIEQVRLKHQLLGLQKELGELELSQAEAIIQQNAAYGDQVILRAQLLEKAEAQKTTAKTEVMEQSFGAPAELHEAFNAIDDDLSFSEGIIAEMNKIDEKFATSGMHAKTYRKQMDELAGKVRAREGVNSPLADMITEKTYGTDKEVKARIKNADYRETTEGKMRIQTRDTAYQNNKNASAFRGVEEKTLKSYIKTAQAERTAVLNSANAKKQYAQASKAAAKDLQTLTNSSKTWAQTVVGISQGIMSMSFGINSLSSAFKTLKDDTLSTGEKMLQVFMSLGMAIPMLMNGYNGLTSSILGTNAMMTIHQGLMLKQITAGNSLALIETILSKAKKGLTDQQKAELIMTQLGLPVEEANILLTEKNTLKTKEEMAAELKGVAVKKLENITTSQGVVAKGLSTAATGLQTFAQAHLNIQLSITNSLMLIIIATIAIAIAAFFALSQVVKMITDWYNKDAIAVEKANEALNRQQEVLKETKEAHEQLIEALEKYETAYNAVQKMTQGTEEWEKAVEDLNAQVIDLITKYPQLNEYVQNNNGILSLNQEGRDKLKEISEQQVTEAEINVSAAQRRLNIANANNNITAMSRNYEIDPSAAIVTGATAGMFGGAKWGAGLGGVAAGGTLGTSAIAGTIIGAIAGAITGGYSTYLATEGIEVAQESYYANQLEDMMREYASNGELYLSLDSTQDEINNLAETLGVNTSEITELIRSNANLIKSNDILMQREMDLLFQDNEVYKNSDYKDVIQKIAVDKFNEVFTDGTVNDEAKTQANREIDNGQYTNYLKAIYGENYNQNQYKVKKEDGKLIVQSMQNGQWSDVGDGVTLKDAKATTSQYLAEKQAYTNISNEVKPEDIIKELTDSEQDFINKGISKDSAITLAKANYLEEDIRFSELKDSDLEILRNNRNILNDEQNQKLTEFFAAGGILGAKNESYREMWNLANADFSSHEYKDAEGNILTGTALEQVKQESEKAKTQIDTIQQWYQQLSDDEKQLAAETVDFKLAQNERLMNQMLEDAKEQKAFAGLESQAEKYELDAEILKTQAKQMLETFKETNPELENAAELAADIAVANQRLNKGVDKLTDNWEDWKKTLKSSDKTTQDYAEAVTELNSALKDILNLSDDTIIPADFWGDEKNIALLEQIGNGSEEAVNKLGQNLVKAQIESAEWSTDIAKNLQDAFNIDPSESENKFNEIKNNLLSTITDMQGALDGLKIGESLNAEDATEFAKKLNEYAKATGMSVEQMQSMLNSLSLKADIKTDTQPMDYEVPEYTTFTSTSDATSEQAAQLGEGNWKATRQVTIQTGTKTMSGAMTVAQIDMGDNPNAPAPKIQGTGRGNIAPSATTGGKNGGGGSKPKKNTGTRKSDTIERYKEENDQLDDLTRAYDKASKAADRLYGGNRLKAMQENNKLLKQESELLKQKAQRGREEYLEEDKKALLKAAGDAGIKQLEFDENGNITNYEEMMTPLYAELKAAYDAAGDTIDDDEQEKIDKIEEKITPLEDAIKTYDDTLNEIEDLEDEAKEKFYEWQDNNYEALQLKLEIQLELSDDELREIEYKLGKWENDFYKRSESAGLYGDQTQVHINNSSMYENQIAELKTAFEVGDISEADYIEGLKEARDGLYEQNEALLELKETMGEYYSETLDMANEKIVEYTDQIDHAASVLDHYINIANILGKQLDYEMMGNFLSGQAQVAKDQMEISSAWYDELIEQQKQQQKDYNDAVSLYGEDSEQAKFAKKELDAVTTVVNEAQDKMLNDTETWLEAEKSVIENEMAKVRKKFEDTFNLDHVMDDFEKLNTRQEEFLTTTNKIYETNKMVRTATQAMEATDNKAAKQRINNFIQETQNLQNKNKLSKYELEIQQSKYDLLLAQIALEEAQNAKSTVRLTRDAEGNFGYVYTADENKVADAEQKVADAENALYNKSLEGQQTYTEKYLQARDEMYNELADLQEKWLNGEIESEEEYNQLKEQILEHYMGENGILTQYSQLYNIAVQTDAKATEDYWGQEYGLMTQDTENWKNAINGYLTENEGHIETWKTISTEAHKSVSDAMSGEKGSAQATKDVTNKSKELKDALIGENGKGGLVDALGKQLTEVNNVTTGFQNQITEIDNVITANEKLITDPDSGINVLIGKYNELKTSIDAANAAAKNTGGSESGISGGNTGNVESDEDVDNTPPPPSPSKSPTKRQITVGMQLDTSAIATAHYRSGVRDGGYAFYPDTKAGSMIIGRSQQISDIYISPTWGKMLKFGNYWFKLSEIVADGGFNGSVFDTGGYTGQWGPEGKLAMLHQKELVLNADDTENFLLGIQMLRSISDILERNAALASMTSSTLSAYTLSNSFGQTLEQEVTIHAEFPNVSDHNEIEIAIDNLINRASQYSYKS